MQLVQAHGSSNKNLPQLAGHKVSWGAFPGALRGIKKELMKTEEGRMRLEGAKQRKQRELDVRLKEYEDAGTKKQKRNVTASQEVEKADDTKRHQEFWVNNFQQGAAHRDSDK